MSETGTGQGQIISPLLANVYLHHVLDQWFEKEVKPRLKGQAFLIRYADDGRCAFSDGGCGEGAGGAVEAVCEVRADAASEEDAPGAFRAPRA